MPAVRERSAVGTLMPMINVLAMDPCRAPTRPPPTRPDPRTAARRCPIADALTTERLAHD